MKRVGIVLWSVGTLCLLALGRTAAADERGIFDYERQRAAGPDVKKIVFIADAGDHGGPGNHEFVAASIMLARQLNANYPQVHAVVYSTNNWPKDLSQANAIIVSLNHGGRAAQDPQIAAAVKRGAGFMAVHFGVEVNKGAEGANFLQWIGGYFETFWSVNPWWTPKFETFPEHPTTRGVKPFSVRDEWYYHMRFVDGMKGVTPILSDLPPLDTIQGRGQSSSDRGGNPAVWEEVSAGKKQHLAWAYDRPDGGRGFGFTGLHLHSLLAVDGFRTILLNGAAWVSKLDIPPGGVPSKTPTPVELDKLLEEARAAIKQGK